MTEKFSLFDQSSYNIILWDKTIQKKILKRLSQKIRNFLMN